MHQGNAAATSVKLVIPSEIRLVDLVHSAAEKMAELAGFDADDALNVGLAVREAVINAMVHGNGGNPALDVRVTLKAGAKGLEARVHDEGEGFDPATTPDPRDDTRRMRTSGRGILLMRAFVDEVTFRRGRSRGMQVTMKKKKAGSGS